MGTMSLQFGCKPTKVSFIFKNSFISAEKLKRLKNDKVVWMSEKF